MNDRFGKKIDSFLGVDDLFFDKLILIRWSTVGDQLLLILRKSVFSDQDFVQDSFEVAFGHFHGFGHFHNHINFGGGKNGVGTGYGNGTTDDDFLAVLIEVRGYLR
jgi:hypothetical protein